MSSALLQNQTNQPGEFLAGLSQNPDYAALMGEAAFAVEHMEGNRLFAIESELRLLDAASLEPNALGGADFLLAASRHCPENIAPEFLTVWHRRHGAPGRLVGLFPLRSGSFTAKTPIIRGWKHPFSVNGVPLLRADVAEAAITAVLIHLARLPHRHAALCLAHIPVEGAFAHALRSVAQTLGLPMDYLAAHRRAAQMDAEDAPAFNKTRRRQRRRLSEQGELTVAMATEYEAVRLGLERFLALEATSWKGAGGTALLSNPGDANFTRAMVWSAARHATVRISELQLNGQIIASVVILTAKNRAFFWKIAFDEAFSAYSPGALLLLQTTSDFLKEGTITQVDSCAQPGSNLAEGVWSGHLEVADIMVSLQDGAASGYGAALARENLRRSLRARVKHILNRMQGRKD